MPSMSRTAASLDRAARRGRKRDRLVEQRQPVAHRAVGGAGDQAERRGLDRDPFRLGDPAIMRDQQLHRHAAQREALAARQHRHRHLVDLGRREDEFDVGRRLFERLQQRVEGVLREHVDFVDDVDLVPRRDRPIAHASVSSRISSTPVREAASISITSTWRSSAIARQCSQSPQGETVGPPVPSGPMQLRARAMIRAVVVLPTPRTPVRMKAWAMRPVAIAFDRVRTIASWPISSAKVCGRYLRARTR